MRGLFAFNGCVEHQTFIYNKIKQFDIHIAVETGTLHGWTSAFLSENIDCVYTMEIREEPLILARQLLSDNKNVNILCGNSIDIFNNILPFLPSNEKIFFYLDAHWEKYWPLFDELKLIGKFIGNRAIIVIDDFKIPNKSYGYDSYNGIDNDINSIEQYLKVIYNNQYKFEYLDGPEEFELIMDESKLTDIESKIYIDWFKGKMNKTTGKILIYGTD